MAKKVVLEDNSGNKCYPVTRDECILSGDKTLPETILEINNILGMVEGKTFDHRYVNKATISSEFLNGEEYFKIQREVGGRIEFVIDNPKTNKLFIKFLIYTDSQSDILVQLYDTVSISYIINRNVTLKQGYNIISLESTDLGIGNKIVIYIGKGTESSTFYIAKKNILYYDLYKPFHITNRSLESLISEVEETTNNYLLNIGEPKVLSNIGVYKDGVIINTVRGFNSGLIPVSEINSGISLDYAAQTNYDLVSFFDNDSTFISGISKGGGGIQSFVLLKRDFPENTKFIAISSILDSEQNFYRTIGTTNLQEKIKENTNNISEIDNRVTGVTGVLFSASKIEYTGTGFQFDYLTIKKIYVDTGTYILKANNFISPEGQVSSFFARAFLKEGGENSLGFCNNSEPEKKVIVTEDIEYIELRFYASTGFNSQEGFIYTVENVSFEKENSILQKIKETEKITEVLETVNAIDAEFLDTQTFVANIKSYTVTTTTVFGKISLDGLEKRMCNFFIRSNDSFHFGLYGFFLEGGYEQILDFPEGTVDYSEGLSFKLDTKDLTSRGFNNIQLRTWKSNVVIDYSLSYTKKSLGAESESVNQWKDAIAALYGDSITAQCNGDYENEFNNSWGGIFANKLGLYKLFARGVGGQTYKWNDGAYYSKVGSTGGYINRYKAKDGKIDTSAGEVSVTTTEEEKRAIESVLGYSIEIHRGCFCSWDRITSMFPLSIKDTIQVVCIMGATNDFSGVEEIESTGTDGSLKPQWSAENQTDTDWKNAERYYNGGDYDVTNTWGGMASCLMKMQVWMPQAKIIVLVPITRKGVNFNVPVNGVGATHQDLCESVKSVADWCGVEAIDMNCCGINQFNVDTMISDGVHPSSEGQKRMGQYLATKFNCIVKYV